MAERTAMRRKGSDRKRDERKRSPNASAGACFGIVGGSDAILEIVELIQQVGPTHLAVLITGEPGTGKELVARALHAVSGRAEFVPLNCAAIPEHLLEGELFGHVRGAFTGAARDKRGLMEAAHGGTLFLDEIGDMPGILQGKLLRAIEMGEIRRLGETRLRAVDCRVIAATNADIDRRVREDRFRQDLLDRIRQFRIHIPPLRERPEDIPVLASHYAGPQVIEDEALQLLVAYSWPGNVRELMSVVAVGAMFAKHGRLGPEHVNRALEHTGAGQSEERPTASDSGLLSLKEMERRHILNVLRAVGGIRKRAAAILEIDPKTLRSKLGRYADEDVS